MKEIDRWVLTSLAIFAVVLVACELLIPFFRQEGGLWLPGLMWGAWLVLTFRAYARRHDTEDICAPPYNYR